jgi:hypothetical protein
MAQTTRIQEGHKKNLAIFLIFSVTLYFHHFTRPESKETVPRSGPPCQASPLTFSQSLPKQGERVVVCGMTQHGQEVGPKDRCLGCLGC